MRRKREAPEGALPLEAESPKAAKRPFAERARWPFLLLGVLALHAVRGGIFDVGACGIRVERVLASGASQSEVQRPSFAAIHCETCDVVVMCTTFKQTGYKGLH